MFSPEQAGGGVFGLPLWLVTCLLPLAIGILGTLGLLAWLGPKPVVDRSSEINDYQSLLSKRDVELRDRETELGNLRSQMKHVEEDYSAIRGDRDRLDTSLKAAEKRSAESNSHVLALQNDLSVANTAKLKFEQDLKRRESDFAAASAKLTGALGDFDKAKLTTAAQIAALTAGAATAAAVVKGRDSKIGELEGKIKGLEADVAVKVTLAKEVEDYKLRLSKLEGAVKEGAEVKLKADKELADLRTQLATAKGEGDKAKAAAGIELAALTAGAATAAAALKGRDSKIGELEARLKTLEADAAARAQEAVDFRTRFEKADTDLKATVGLKGEWETKLSSRDKELADLRTQLAGVKGDADKAKAVATAELAALTAGAATAAAALKGKDTKIGELEARLKTLEADAAARAQEAVDFRTRFEKADTDLKATFGLKGAWDTQLSTKDKELGDLRARIAKLEADLKTGMDAKARVEADRDLRDRELGDLRTRLAGLQGDVEKTRGIAAAELAALTAGAATAAATLKVKDSRIGDLEKRLAAMEAEVGGMRTRREQALADAQGEIASLRANMTKSQTDWEARLLARESEWKAQLETSTAKLAQTSALLVDAQTTRNSVAAAAAKLGLKAVVAACPQHLSDIRGIGTVFEQRLFENGIGTFFEVAHMSDEDMTRALQITGETVKSVDFNAIRADALRLAKETDTQGRTWSGEEPDDFEPIDGIGHTFEKRLYDAGLCTYQALLNTPQDEIERIISKGKKLVTKPDIPYWLKQATELLAKKGGNK